MDKVWATKKGFTIVELLVSIVVIGILVGITVVSYNGIQQRTRDSQRDSDITRIKIALEKYHAEKSQYPRICPIDYIGCPIGLLEPELSPYLDAVPHDPSYKNQSGSDYIYVQARVIDDSYGILIPYEAKPMCKTGHNVAPGWWGAVPVC